MQAVYFLTDKYFVNLSLQFVYNHNISVALQFINHMQPCKLSGAQSVPESKSVHPAAACMSCTHLGSFGVIRHKNTLVVCSAVVSGPCWVIKSKKKDECFAVFLYIEP